MQLYDRVGLIRMTSARRGKIQRTSCKHPMDAVLSDSLGGGRQRVLAAATCRVYPEDDSGWDLFDWAALFD